MSGKPEGNVSGTEGATDGQAAGGSGGQQVAYQSDAQGGGGQSPAEESLVDAIQRPVPMSFVKGITAIMGALGVLLGAGVYVIAEFGGRSLLPGMVNELQGVSGLSEGLAASHQLTLAYVANELAIFLSFLLAPVFGVLVLLKLDDTVKAKMGAAGVGVAVGTVAFSFITVALASAVAPTAADFMAIGEGLQGAAGAGAAPTGSEAEILEGTNLGSVNMGNALTNAVLIAIPAGLAAAAVVYVDDRFFEA